MTPRLGHYLLIAPPVMLLSGAALYHANAPFGWVQVLVVYLLATFPLCMLLAEWAAAHVQGRLLLLASAILGLAIVLATWLAGRHFTEWLYYREASFFVRQGALGLWCILLQLPLCLFGRWLVTQGGWNRPAQEPSWASLLLALFAAVILPAVYLTRLIDVESKRAEEYLQAGRLAKAFPLVDSLYCVGSQKPLSGSTPGEVQLELIYKLMVVDPPGSLSWTDAQWMELARLRALQGSYEEAAQLLLQVSNPTPEAVLLLASVYKEQQKWKDCNQCCRAAIKLLERLPRNDETLPFWVKVYDNLGAAAQEQQRYADAQAAYEEALRRVSPARAHFHLQLGRLHHAAGRPGKALHHLDEAAKLDPEGYGVQAKPVLDEIRTQTPGCLLRWWGP